MDAFTASAITHLLDARLVDVSRDWSVRVLDARLVDEYGGTSVVLELLGNWLLLVRRGGPDEGKPSVWFEPPLEVTSTG